MNACIVGWGHTPFGRSALSLEELITTVTREALADAGVDAADVDAIWLGHFNGGFVPMNFTSSLVLQADEGLRWKPATRVENACATGAAAVFQAIDAVEACRARIALVVGVEKMTAVTTQQTTQVLANASYVEEEADRGITFPGLFADLAQRYFAAHGDHSATLARIAAKNHANGARNPYAHLRRDLGFDFCNTVSPGNPIVAAPLRRTDCSLISDGAAALVLADASTARAMRKRVRVRARAQVNDFLPVARRELTTLEGPRRAWGQTLEQAGCELKDLSLLEVHDCFTIAELLLYEALGLAPVGRGAQALDSGLVYPSGDLPVNPSGGLKAKGHPIGATGVSMHVLAAMQLCGVAGDIQVPAPQLAGILNMGGTAVANYASILEAVS
ncbi:acetyl-CoA acetyltransferase [Sinimarinibacterium flocculans]|uniref:acetyl-CoA acetyltransferase n=1 Tax=Sinimarinibacterium flocculans TaxID=985250 RepID=UPI0024902FB6|nr:acetyl-CoA acetyltransferase [Sinimarinibacterium flocculans]